MYCLHTYSLYDCVMYYTIMCLLIILPIIQLLLLFFYIHDWVPHLYKIDENKNMSIIFEISTRADLVCITVSKYR